MKLIKIIILVVSLFAIVGTALFQLFVLLTSAPFAQQDNSRHTSQIS
jgi:hypothetical protein